MGGRRHHVLSYVTIPTLAAPFFAALKTGGPLAILGVIGGEFIASSQGDTALVTSSAAAACRTCTSGVMSGWGGR